MLQEMVVETIYNAIRSKFACIGGETNELTGICHNKPYHSERRLLGFPCNVP